MIIHVFAVRDKKLSSFNPPMFFLTHGHAERAFGDMVNNPEAGDLFNHAEDFDLFLLGSWDSDTGLFTCGVPSFVATASSYKKSFS